MIKEIRMPADFVEKYCSKFTAGGTAIDSLRMFKEHESCRSESGDAYEIFAIWHRRLLQTLSEMV